MFGLGWWDSFLALLFFNLFGAIWVTQAAIPLLREQGSGHIIQVSSIGGISAFPTVGAYHASKWGLEGLSQSLAQEVAGFGINVTLVEPGPFRTDWAGRSIVESETVIDDYAGTAGLRRQQTRDRSGNQVGDPVRAAEAVIAAVTAPEPPLRLLLGAPALDLAYAKLDTLRANFDAWRETTLGADYPEHQRKA